VHKKVLALSAIAALGITGTAHAVEADQGLQVKVSGGKGTKAKPKNVKLSVTTTTAGKGATPDGTFGTQQAVVFLDKNLKFNFKNFATCDEATVSSNAAKCAKGSLVGKGDSKAVAGPGGRIVVTPKVEAYNGGGGKLFLRTVTQPGQFDSSGVLTGTLKKASGLYGQKLVVKIPPKLQEQFGLKVTIQKFFTAITAVSKGVGYVQSTGCSGGKYNFKSDFTHTDGSTLSALATSKC
jgi:hypothetical protein